MTRQAVQAPAAAPIPAQNSAATTANASIQRPAGSRKRWRSPPRTRSSTSAGSGSVWPGRAASSSVVISSGPWRRR
ncbi:hypothetical protein [Catenuloplanes indicus]|uniref:Uncharacterized protein n=1 Tax=Catenuloplanes indicus TaxID=137267 RepID=A0AAE3VVS4_9ACTN|nr:hypothetical protein [Catenuloplanes indicus]MDQ0364565.1 hypothetical protein [Catenuloplanes indicus]